MHAYSSNSPTLEGLVTKATRVLQALPIPRPSQRLFFPIISGFCVCDGDYSNSKHYAYFSSLNYQPQIKPVDALLSKIRILLLYTTAPSKRLPPNFENYIIIFSPAVGYLCDLK